MTTVELTASEIIDRLGGTAAVAKICDVRSPSVSEWRRDGIPSARMMYLRAIRPDAFEDGYTVLVQQPQDQQKAA